MEENEDSPQLKGIVIITLPPADNPSLGKTITAFTVTNDQQLPPLEHNHHNNQVEPPQQPSQPQENLHQSPHAGLHFSSKRLLFYSPIVIFGLLSLSLIALSYWVSFSQKTLYELREIDDDQGSNSILFPLFPKVGSRGSLQGDFELKLGRFMESNSKIGVETLSDGSSQRKSAKSVIAESKVDSTNILPLKGNIFSDGSVADISQIFKPLDLHFGSKWWIMSTKLQIPPEGYLVINNKGNVCLGILDGSQVHDGSTLILGDISLRGQLFVYDNVNHKIGWIKSDCLRPKKLERLQFS